MPLNIFLIIVGIILVYVGYQIADRTQSDSIQFMGWIVVIVGVALIADGIGIITIPQLSV